ncbi:MAG: ATP-dependent DNA helicase RecG [Rhodospirillales bacterium]
MRPQPLFSLFASVRTLPGVGAQVAVLLERLAGARVIDLLWHLPTGTIDRRPVPTLCAVEPGTMITVAVRVEAHQPARSPRQPYRVQCRDAAGTGRLALVFFHARGDYLERMLPIGSMRVVSGVIDDYGGEAQMTHPDYIVAAEEAASIPAFEPIYPLTTGLTNKQLRRLIAAAVDKAPPLAEWLDPTLLARRGWPAWRDALSAAHTPTDAATVSGVSPARCRLAYDELLANQLALSLTRAHNRREAGRAITLSPATRERHLAALPFRLTASQRKALAEITADMAEAKRMLRLLQGDVGSGKTVVAGLAMLAAVAAGHQAALMAPTELLARQHAKTLAPMADAAGVRLALLTGRAKGAERQETLAALAAGEIGLVVGTHALVQEAVIFADLALVVIDEQHRFGVHQRLTLTAKGAAADVLVMTATPIPRTLMLAAYGDLDSSRITEKPPGRRPVTTRAVPLDRLDEVVDALGRALDEGAKAYWICPLVTASEAIDAAAAESRFAALAERFGARVGLVHGRLGGAEKDRVMRGFADGSIDILVATTVVEVGVDVPQATVMVIEHAERFGLAQLHQLRGRIGRGRAASSCILLYAAPLTETARARLRILRETDDGFLIAEEDLRLRGAGELLGVRQSGLPDFRIADLALHADLLPMARDDAQLTLGSDPDLTTPRGRALRTMLYLFERDAAIRYLRSG